MLCTLVFHIGKKYTVILKIYGVVLFSVIVGFTEIKRHLNEKKKH